MKNINKLNLRINNYLKKLKKFKKKKKNKLKNMKIILKI